VLSRAAVRRRRPLQGRRSEPSGRGRPSVTRRHFLEASVVAAALGGVSAARGQAEGNADTPRPVKVKRKPGDAEWTEYAPRTVGMLAGFDERAFPSPPLTRWGGRADRKGKATGFFHVEKQGERWWLVDPDGGLFLHVGVAAIAPGTTPTSRAALGERYASPADWASRTTRYLREQGFNGAGAWSNVPLLRDADPKERLVYTVIGNTGVPGAPNGGSGGFMSTFGKQLRATTPGVGHTNYPNGCIPVFHPDFPVFCNTFAKPLAALKDDPYLLGYFSDNELPFPKLENFLALPPGDAAMGSSQAAAKQWLEARKGKGATADALTDADRDAWVEHVFDRYLALTTGAIRKYDPNHMCLGPRFYGPEKNGPAAFRAAGRHLDALGINHYFVWDPKPGSIARWTEWSGKPILLTE
jgi:hypothetical protein